jgi:hypothetical protein
LILSRINRIIQISKISMKRKETVITEWEDQGIEDDN